MKPGQDAYLLIRSGILAKQKRSFKSHVSSLGVLPTTARNACLGSSNSPQAQKLFRKLLKDAGIGA